MPRKAIKQVRLRECRDCHLVVGVLGSAIPQVEYEPTVVGPVVRYLKSPPSRFALWLADQLDGLENAFAVPRWLLDWYHQTF